MRTARRALGKRQAQDERRGERERRRRDLLGYEKKERRGEEKRGGGERGREIRKLRAARRALGKRQAQDERIETCADGLQGSDGRRGEEKRGE